MKFLDQLTGYKLFSDDPLHTRIVLIKRAIEDVL
jgi:hypothetical protein